MNYINHKENKAKVLRGSMLCLVTVFLFLVCNQRCFADFDGITRAEAALYIAEQLGIEHSDSPEDLYGLAYNIFPGDYDGKNDVTNYEKDMTTEIAVVVLVRYAGWNTVQYSKELAERVAPFVTQEGFPYYQPDPTPRSIPYVTVAIERGLLEENELESLTKVIGYEALDTLIERLKEIEEEPGHTHLFIPENSVSEANNSIPECVIVDNNMMDDESLYSGEDVAVDFRSEGIRIYKGKTVVSGGRQSYFPLGPLESMLSVGLEIPAESFTHQSEGVYSTIHNYSPTTNGVALWGEARSKAKGSRVWGGFLNVASEKNLDAQLVGLEIDVTNDSLPGVSPNESKVGMQIVALGPHECTNGIELLAAGKSSWHNGILLTNGTISEDGTILGCSQETPVKTGIDFSNTPFTNAAIDISNNSKIVMQSKSGNPAAIYTDDINDGYLVMQAGASGLRITNNANDANLLILNADGTISPDCLAYQAILGSNKTENGTLQSGIILCLAVVCVFLGWKLYMQNKRMLKIEKVIEDITPKDKET